MPQRAEGSQAPLRRIRGRGKNFGRSCASVFRERVGNLDGEVPELLNRGEPTAGSSRRWPALGYRIARLASPPPYAERPRVVRLTSIAHQLYSHVAMQAAALDAVFAALSDPTRRAILARLAQGEATVSELAEPFGLRQSTISKHLKVLDDAGLIVQTRDAQRRPRRLVMGGPLSEVDRWLAPFRAQWEGRFNRLDTHLKSKREKSKP